jgi:hypothetical protein
MEIKILNFLNENFQIFSIKNLYPDTAKNPDPDTRKSLTPDSISPDPK